MKRRVETITFDGSTLEYSVTGKGTPILVMHGGHSNCYEEFGYTALIEQGYSIITPSRPGYRRTSKEIGKSLANACRFYVKLLDHLQIDSVHVIAISAGRAERHMLCLTLSRKSKYIDSAIRGHQRVAHPKRH